MQIRLITCNIPGMTNCAAFLWQRCSASSCPLQLSLCAGYAMVRSNTRGGEDQCAVEAVVTELAVLDRLVYKSRSQHRSAKYFSLVLEARRACRGLAAPKLPDLISEGLGLLARVPDSRNGRARDAWVRSASAGLGRMRGASVACAAALEAIVQASKHLAHQVSQTYFMALSVVLLACLARVFACSLHLGARLLEVHEALLRTVLAQPCISECQPPGALVACRIPEETISLLTCLRNAAGDNKKSGKMKASSSGDAPTTELLDTAAGAAGAATSGSTQPVTDTGISSTNADGSSEEAAAIRTDPSVQQSGAAAGSGLSLAFTSRSSSGLAAGTADTMDDEGDTGVRIGRVAVKSAGTGVAAVVEEKGPVERAAADGETRDWGRGSSGGGEQGGKGRSSGDDSRGGDARRRESRGSVPPAKKNKMILACEFSDSSSDDDADGRNGRKPVSKTATPPEMAAAEASRVALAPKAAELQPFFISKRRQPTQPQRNQIVASTPLSEDASIPSVTPGNSGGVSSGGACAVGTSSSSTAPADASAKKTMWVIDRGPAKYTVPAELAVTAAVATSRRSSTLEEKRSRRSSGADYRSGATFNSCAEQSTYVGDGDLEVSVDSVDVKISDRPANLSGVAAVTDAVERSERVDPKDGRPSPSVGETSRGTSGGIAADGGIPISLGGLESSSSITDVGKGDQLPRRKKKKRGRGGHGTNSGKERYIAPRPPASVLPAIRGGGDGKTADVCGNKEPAPGSSSDGANNDAWTESARAMTAGVESPLRGKDSRPAISSPLAGTSSTRSDFLPNIKSHKATSVGRDTEEAMPQITVAPFQRKGGPKGAPKADPPPPTSNSKSGGTSQGRLTARMERETPEQEIDSRNGGGTTTKKRSSDGEGRPSKKKKRMKGEKSAKARSGGIGGAGANAIDDIFGSLF